MNYHLGVEEKVNHKILKTYSEKIMGHQDLA
jgi:hypothetical protein